MDGDNADMGMLGGGGDAAIPNPFEALSLSRRCSSITRLLIPVTRFWGE